ncbi:hypothetical protein AK812_SmicGene19723 [Symbiodinium microadriaticum]|uniref:Uncharacterized protein n=1 Tax=Symbiodinium microadriaticum TaxID=2951 RepID=A0A1Q9DRT1_SYMMI|nr:hypothetical protein AK812_SmicGene19723 [Symbiodinium microadriaticum]
MSNVLRRWLVWAWLIQTSDGNAPLLWKPTWNVSLLKGSKYGFRGDARCFRRHLLREWNEPANTEVKIERRTSWLFRDVCCSLGRTSPCWYGQLTFQRCCMTKAPALPQGGFGLPIKDVWDFRKESACWPSPILTATCCRLTLPQMCASDAWGKDPWALLKSCCKKPGLDVRAHLLPELTLSALASVKEFWRSLQGYFNLAPTSNSSLPELRAGASNWLNVTSSSIRESILRIDSQARELASLATRRKRHGFNVNLVMPVCGDHDMEHLDTMERSVLQETRPLNDVVDLYIYDVCFRFCESAAYGLENDVEELPTGEVAPNLHHVSRHYDDLPDFMMILHPDGYEHVEIFALVSVLNSLALIPRFAQESALFFEENLGGKDSFLERYTTRDPTGPYCQWVELAWELLFDYGGYDFAQYIASRKAARSRPKSFWQNAWRSLCSASNYQLLLGTKFISWRELTSSEGARGDDSFHKGLTTAFEHLYHVIFNPGAKTWLWPTRLRDPSLPLGLKFAMGGNPTLLRHYRWTPHQPL